MGTVEQFFSFPVQERQEEMKSEIIAKVNPENIDMLTKIIEAYDNLGIVSTLNRDQGLVIIRGTEDTYPELQQILTHIPFPIETQ
jgi:hypothetical protein